MKLFTLIVLLSSVSMPALAKQVPTQAPAKLCEKDQAKVAKTAFTANQKGTTNTTTRAN